jgi:hypothetical protein
MHLTVQGKLGLIISNEKQKNATQGWGGGGGSEKRQKKLFE